MKRAAFARGPCTNQLVGISESDRQMKSVWIGILIDKRYYRFSQRSANAGTVDIVVILAWERATDATHRGRRSLQGPIRHSFFYDEHHQRAVCCRVGVRLFSFLEQLARHGRSLIGEESERMRGPTVRYSARKATVSVSPIEAVAAPYAPTPSAEQSRFLYWGTRTHPYGS